MGKESTHAVRYRPDLMPRCTLPVGLPEAALSSSGYWMRARFDYAGCIAASSAAIRISRVLCIFFMAYVHVHLLAHEGIERSAPFIVVSTVFRDALGRSSVPLLSVISGFLMIGYFGRRTLRAVYISRFTSLIVPLLFWVLVGLCVRSALGDPVAITPNELFPFTGSGWQIHLTFLRDVFVLVLITPLLIALLKKGGIFALAALELGALSFEMGPVLLREQVLFYYVLGLFFGIWEIRPIASKAIFRGAVFLSMGGIIVWLVLERTGIVRAPTSLKFFDFDTLLRRPVCALSFWYLANWISSCETARTFVVKYLEPAAYLLFLSHCVATRLLSGIYSQLGFLHAAPLYVAAWLAIPIGCTAMAVLGKMLLKRGPPALSILVSGKD